MIRDGRIDVVADGPAPAVDGARRVDGSGCLATPGLINAHHHLYQWITRGYAQNGTLFEWLTTLYPIWRHLDTDLEYHAGRAALASLALSGCTTTTDHHYLFPRDGGDVFAAEVEAARQIGLRFHPGRGSMDLGQSRGGLPPDDGVEDRDEILLACEHAVSTYHDPAPDSMLRVALAPCSPFSVTGELLRESSDLARRLGVRMHTHLAETVDEAEFCLGKFGCGPVDYVEQVGWLGDDVWLAHCVHLSSSDIAKFAASGTAVAHCPSSNGRLGSGIAPVPELLASGGRSGSVSTGSLRMSTVGWLTSYAKPCSSRDAAKVRRRSPPARHCGSARWAALGASDARPRSAHCRPESWPTSPCGGSTISGMPTSPIPCARSFSGRPPLCSCCSSAARWLSTAASYARPTANR